jgi:chromosome segregation ATPase
MQYLVAQMLMCLLVAGLLGLLVGWLLWGTLVRRARERVMEMEQRVSKLSGYPARLTDLEGTHAAFVASRNEESEKLKSRIAELESQVRGKDLEIASLAETQPAVLAKSEVNGASQAQSEPLRARAVAAGSSRYYEVGSTNIIDSPSQPPPDAARELEKRMEASKDAELERLRTRLAEIERQPDPDVRRQILLSGKNAELTHLRRILNSLFQPLSHDEIARRAYYYAQERGFLAGSPTEDWLRAERDSHFGRLAYAWESTRPGTMF